MAKKQDWIIGIIIGSSLLFVFLIALIAIGLIGMESDGLSISGDSARKVALIEIKGPIFSSSSVIKQLKKYSDDDSVPAVVVRIDSPGGAVVPSQEIYETMLKVRSKGKKVIVSMGSVAASGGYYIAAAADTIVASPATITGSIGVIAQLANAKELLKKIGLEFDVVKSGKYKDMGAFSKELTKEERELLQGVIDDTYNQFIEAIVSQRKLTQEEVIKLADGRIFTGRQALEYGFVDVLGNYQDAIDIAAQMTGLEKDPKTVVEKRRGLKLLDMIMDIIMDRIFLGERGSHISLRYMLL